MPVDDRVAFLRSVPMFAEMDDAELASLARDMRVRTYETGEMVFFQGVQLLFYLRGPQKHTVGGLLFLHRTLLHTARKVQ